MPGFPTDPEFLTTKQAGDRLGVTPSRIRQLILEGRLKADKAGRDWFIRSRDLEKIEPRAMGRPPKSQ